MEEIDITKLLNSSGKDLYEDIDPRLTGFIEEAVSTVYTNKFGSDVAKTKKASFCHNIVENFLKARNLRFVSLFGLSLLTLVYIFSGRSLQTCNMFSATGAKGTHKIVTNYVLPNSKETSYRPCADGVTVYYSFDNIQKLFRIWRLYGSGQEKSLAKIATSIVHCYPDGLLSSNVQYVLRHSPMIWLYKFQINDASDTFIEKLDSNVIEKLLHLDEDDLDIVLGRWDLKVENAIKEVKKEAFDGNDVIDKILNVREKMDENNVRFCSEGHRNEKPRSNQKNCKFCKNQLIVKEDIIEGEKDDENVDYGTDTFMKMKIIEKETGPIEVLITDTDLKTKSDLFPRMRNVFNENKPIYVSQGITYVNPNSFIRVKMVLDEIQTLTKTNEKHTTLLKIEEDNTISTEVTEVNNMRTWIVVTLDGLPHKLAINVIKHCYQCELCGKDITVNTDVIKHFEKTGHRLFWKKYANIILKIGGLHAEMNMLRSFVSLNWKIIYSFMCKSIGFLSPKAQILQQKVQDMHKSWDTFNTTSDALTKPGVKLFVEHTEENDIDANAENFETWLEKDVKNQNLKLMMTIQMYFGTSLWLYHAGQRANYFKLYRAAMRVFAGLFHINGNLNYSAIEVFDDYLMTSLEIKDEELFNHLKTRLCTNLKERPFCAQSHDARHEESNKLAQNMFPGKDLEELDLAFTIVDDVHALRKKVFIEKGINDRSEEENVVIPDYRKNVVLMRCDIRQSKYFEEPHIDQPLQSIDGHTLHANLPDIFKISRQRREADILNAYRFNDFSLAYNPKSRIAILENDKEYEASEKDLKEEIMILIHLLENDLQTQSVIRDLFEKVKSQGAAVLKNFLEHLVTFLFFLLCFLDFFPAGSASFLGEASSTSSLKGVSTFSTSSLLPCFVAFSGSTSPLPVVTTTSSPEAKLSL